MLSYLLLIMLKNISSEIQLTSLTYFFYVLRSDARPTACWMAIILGKYSKNLICRHS